MARGLASMCPALLEGRERCSERPTRHRPTQLHDQPIMVRPTPLPETPPPVFTHTQISTRHSFLPQDVHTQCAPLVKGSLDPIPDLLALPYLHDSVLLQHIRQNYWYPWPYQSLVPGQTHSARGCVVGWVPSLPFSVCTPASGR